MAAPLLAGALVLAACGGSDDGAEDGAAEEGVSTEETAEEGAAEEEAGSSLEDLIAAAQEEGTVVWYTATPTEASDVLAAAFEEEYGITVEFLKQPSAELLTRYQTEADAGSIAADVLVGPGMEAFAAGIGSENGWVRRVPEAPIPALEDYPDEFVGEWTVTLQANPWGIAYNTDLLAEEDYPTTWADLTDPVYSGQILFPDPRASAAYIELYDMLSDELGDDFLTGLAANDFELFESGGTATEALAAGVGSVAPGRTGASVQGVIDAGAPVEFVIPDLTTGVQQELLLSAEDQSPNPNAGLLLAHYLMTEEGNTLLAETGGELAVLGDGEFPSEYIAPPADAADRADAILEQLGIS